MLTKQEASRVIDAISGTHQLMAKLLYGCGLRLMECVRLRVKDIDFGQNHITVRDTNEMKDQVTILPSNVKTPSQQHLQYVKILHEKDLPSGHGQVYLPYALKRKFKKRIKNGAGNTFSLGKAYPWTREPAKYDAIISMRAAYRRR